MERIDTCTLWRECIACNNYYYIKNYDYVHAIKNVV